MNGIIPKSIKFKQNNSHYQKINQQEMFEDFDTFNQDKYNINKEKYFNKKKENQKILQ